MGKAIQTDDLFKRADELADEKAEVYAAITANRELLRNLDDSGMLTDAESEKLEEVYPRITRSKSEDKG